MQIGRFFSLGRGRVGQYLSPRVLVVRTPFQTAKPGQWQNFCCFGFSNAKQAQTFMQSLAYAGLTFRLRQSQLMPHYPLEVLLLGHSDLASTLADWERRHSPNTLLPPKAGRPQNQQSASNASAQPSLEAIAA